MYSDFEWNMVHVEPPGQYPVYSSILQYTPIYSVQLDSIQTLNYLGD